MTLPSVAIVIPTCKRPELLKRCLSRLVPYVAMHPECSITVSDDGDASVTRAVLDGELGIVNIVQGPHRGPAANRNCGAAHSEGILLIFLDDDCTPEPSLIAAYQDAAEKHPEIGVFEGRISAQGTAKGFADACPENETGGYLWSCNFAIRRELFTRISGFDERFPFAAVEDSDFHFRVKQLATVLFLRDARVWHSYERRLGWKPVKHHALSLVLFMHIHGLKATRQGPVKFLKSAIKRLIEVGNRLLRRRTALHPMQGLRVAWVNLQLAVIASGWKFHAKLAAMFYPPCCSSCESIHSHLRGN